MGERIKLENYLVCFHLQNTHRLIRRSHKRSSESARSCRSSLMRCSSNLRLLNLQKETLLTKKKEDKKKSKKKERKKKERQKKEIARQQRRAIEGITRSLGAQRKYKENIPDSSQAFLLCVSL